MSKSTRRRGSNTSHWISLPYYLFSITIVLTGFLALAISFLILKTRSLVYSVYLLAFLGLSIAGLMALLGFQVIGAIHVIVYVGASILFFIISVSMMGDIKIELSNPRELAALSLTLFLVLFFALKTVCNSLQYHPGPTIIEGTYVSRILSIDYSYPLLLAVFALATSIVESIVIAKKVEGE